MLPLSGKTIPVAILSYYCNKNTHFEVRQGPLFLIEVAKEFEDLLLLGSGDWDTNEIDFNFNLSIGQTSLTAELDIVYGSPKECYSDLYGWLMDSAPSTLREHFGRFRGNILEANEPVGNGVALAEWARKSAKRFDIPLPDAMIRTVSVCSDLVFEN
jgi:hypothetical protein